MSQNAKEKENGKIRPADRPPLDVDRGPASFATIKEEATAEYEEKRSVFIAHAKPVKSEAEAVEFIRSVKAKHHSARHNVSAYLLACGGIMRYSDDGEPQGSAGVPVLECIKKAGVSDAAVVVTRYFGGILLGAGGLVRAYTKAASAALTAAGVVNYEAYDELELSCSYAEYQRVIFELSAAGALLDGTDFAEEVVLRFAVKKNETQAICARLFDVLSGRSAAVITGERYDCR